MSYIESSYLQIRYYLEFVDKNKFPDTA